MCKTLTLIEFFAHADDAVLFLTRRERLIEDGGVFKRKKMERVPRTLGADYLQISSFKNDLLHIDSF